MPKKAIVIGGGLGGLATAALLGKKGLRVTLLEKNATFGGRAQVFDAKGFKFDMGPSWYLMNDVFDRFYANFGKKPSDFFKLTRLDPQYRIFYEGEEVIDISKDLHTNYELFERLEKGSAARIKEYLRQGEHQYKIAMDKFIYKNYDSLFDMLDPRLAIEGLQLGLFKSFDGYVNKFTRNDKLKKILEYTIVFLGGSPKKTPALYSMMSHIDFNMGVYYPMGGINKIVQSLEKLCRQNGVKLVPNAEVTRIEVENGRATGVHFNGKFLPADVVISNADYAWTETRLLEEKYQAYPKGYWKKATIAPSALIMYIGVKGKVKSLAHHNLILANDWKVHFEEIFDKPCWPENPSYYVSCPSKTDPSVAPKTDENLFILVPVASGLLDEAKIRAQYAKKILAHLERTIGEKFANRIKFMKIHAHSEFKSLYHAYKGTALGLAHTLMQTASFRPKSRSKKVSNLYYAGQYTHPGIGMPMVLIAAELAAGRISNEIKK